MLSIQQRLRQALHTKNIPAPSVGLTACTRNFFQSGDRDIDDKIIHLLREEQEKITGETARAKAACDHKFLSMSGYARLERNYFEYSANKRPPVNASQVEPGDFNLLMCETDKFGQPLSAADVQKCVDKLPSLYEACRNEALHRHDQATQEIDKRIEAIENGRAFKR